MFRITQPREADVDDIRRLLDQAARRLFAADFLRVLIATATAAGAVLLAAVVVEKLGPWTFRWPIVFAAAGGFSVLAAAVVAVARRPRGLALADEVDRRAGLRETLSTAVQLDSARANPARSGSTHPEWAAAVIDTARERARRVVLRDAVPITAPNRWPVPIVLAALALGVLMFAPRHDLTGMLAREQAAEDTRAQIQATALELRSGEDRLREILADTPVELEDEPATDEAAKPDEPKSPDELKRSALRKLTKLSDELNAAANSEQAKSLDAMQRQIERLRTPGPGPATEFARALARGEFAEAKAALEELAAQANTGEMSPEQRAAAAEQMKALAEQMERLAEEREELKRALENAGMSAEQAEALASDPAGLQQALEQMPGMSQAQAQSLVQQAQAQSQASQTMQSMAQAMEQMAESMQNGQPMPQQAMQQMSQQLSQCEMAAAEMDALRRAMAECNGQMQALGQGLCEKPGGGPGLAAGNGMGRRAGAGEGGSQYDPDAPPADDYVLNNEKTDVPNLGGPIIGSTLVYGAQVRGEAQAQFGEVVNASAVQAAEAIDSMRVPREYHDAVRHYFGRLEAAAKRGDAPAPASADTPGNN